MGFVNKVITRLDSEEKYGALMMDLGCRHLSYGAKPQYIDVSYEYADGVMAMDWNWMVPPRLCGKRMARNRLTRYPKMT